jgi:hypothetical protein
MIHHTGIQLRCVHHHHYHHAKAGFVAMVAHKPLEKKQKSSNLLYVCKKFDVECDIDHQNDGM